MPPSLSGATKGRGCGVVWNSIASSIDTIVYVDSGSTDDSLAIARELNVEIVELDLSIPFTAARARNNGWRRIMAGGDRPFAIQFVDGDCRIEPGWLDRGMAQLTSDDCLGIVTGWRREIHPELSLYNDLCDVEWQRPPGEIATCGGDMMVRTTALKAVDGFRDDVIAAEDDEFCARIREGGWRIYRLPVIMTRHDANMHRFSQWWRRAVRSGHGFAQVGHLHRPYFARELRRVAVFGAALPAIAVVGANFGLLMPLIVLAVYGVSYIRTVQGLQGQGLSLQRSLRHAVLLSISKFPNAIGVATFYWRLLTGRKMQLIEYK